MSASERAGGRLAATLFLVLGGLLAGSLLAEGALRVLGPALGPALRAFVNEEAEAWASSSSRVTGGTRLILRDADFEKASDVVLLGDSMVFGTLVAEDAVFATLLARHSGLRVLNLGVPSAGPCVYERMLELALRRLPQPPRLVLYGVFANDLVESPCAALRDEDLFVWDSAARDRLSFRLRSLRERVLGRSRLYQLLKRYAGFGSLQAGPGYAPIAFDDGRQAFLFAPPGWWRPQLDLDGGARAGFERLVEHAARAAARARNAGSRLVTLLIPSKEQVHLHELVRAGRLPRADYDPVYDRTYDALAARLTALQLPSVDLREPLRAKARAGAKLYWTLDGHLTPRGHAAVAEALEGLVASARSAPD